MSRSAARNMPTWPYVRMSYFGGKIPPAILKDGPSGKLVLNSARVNDQSGITIIECDCTYQQRDLQPLEFYSRLRYDRGLLDGMPAYVERGRNSTKEVWYSAGKMHRLDKAAFSHTYHDEFDESERDGLWCVEGMILSGFNEYASASLFIEYIKKLVETNRRDLIDKVLAVAVANGWISEGRARAISAGSLLG